MNKIILIVLLAAAPMLAAAQTEFSFDSASGRPGLPDAPATPVTHVAAGKPVSGHPAAALMGQYSLLEKAQGECYERLQVVPESFLNTLADVSIGIYGLPEGEGLIVSQVLEINSGLRFDRQENPMGIFPFQSGLIGYVPRQADFDGKKLVYKTGEPARQKPSSIKKGEIVEAVLEGKTLKISKGTFDGANVSFNSVCKYLRVN